MNIQFVQLEHRENILNLMEICHMELKEAYQLYVSCGYNLEAAIQTKLHGGFENEPIYIPPQVYQPPIINNFNQWDNEMDEDEQLYEKYRNFRAGGYNFNQRYTVRKHQGFFKSLIPTFLKKGDQNSFKNKVENYLARTCQIQFAIGNLSQSLQQIWRTKFPLIVHLYDFNKTQIKPLLIQLFNDQFLIDVFNTQFRSYGIQSTYDIQPDLKRFFNFQNDSPGLVILRIDLTDQINVLGKIKFTGTTTLDQVRKKLKQIKSNTIQLELNQSALEKRYQNQLMGNYNYQKPMTFKEKRKIIQDRNLRRKQQQQYSQMKKVQTKKQQIQIPTRSYKQQINKQIKKSQTKQQLKQIKKPIDTKKVKLERQKQRQNMKQYTQGINIRLRFPSGQSKIIIVGNQQKVQYLFDFVNCYQKQIGFQDDNIRSFEIFRPYDKLYLQQLRQKTLVEVFQGSDSQNLVVAEK